MFSKIFYADEATQPSCSKCNLCNLPITQSVWAHILGECKMLDLVDINPCWLAFIGLLRLGH